MQSGSEVPRLSPAQKVEVEEQRCNSAAGLVQSPGFNSEQALLRPNPDLARVAPATSPAKASEDMKTTKPGGPLPFPADNGDRMKPMTQVHSEAALVCSHVQKDVPS